MSFFQNKKSYSEKLKEGKDVEVEVEKFFKSKGFKTRLNIFYDDDGNETHQKITIKGKEMIYPDIEISMIKNSIEVKYLIEVKSTHKYVNIGFVDCDKLSPDEYYVSIPQYQFLDYVKLQNYMKVPIKVIFVIKNDGSWLGQSLDFLDETKLSVENAYNDKTSHYFWNIDWLKRLK